MFNPFVFNQLYKAEIKSYPLILETIAKQCLPPAQVFCMRVEKRKLFNNLLYASNGTFNGCC